MAEKTFTSATLTSSDMNTYGKHTGNGWNSWTPVVTQSNTPALNNVRSTYFRAGRFITATALVGITGTGTSSNAVLITVPASMAVSNSSSILGEGFIYDSSAGFYYYGLLVYNSSTTVAFRRRTDGAGATALGSSGFTAALANNDVVSILVTYESAS